MERINLNVPEELRRSLRRLAKRVGKTESVLARELLFEALEAREREAFYRRVAETQTSEVSSRDLMISESLEKPTRILPIRMALPLPPLPSWQPARTRACACASSARFSMSM